MENEKEFVANVRSAVASQFLKTEVILDILVRAGLTTVEEIAMKIAEKGETIRSVSTERPAQPVQSFSLSAITRDPSEEAHHTREVSDDPASFWTTSENGDFLVQSLLRLSPEDTARVTPQLLRVLDKAVTRAVTGALKTLENSKALRDIEWCAWAERWLSGEDRSLESATAVPRKVSRSARGLGKYEVDAADLAAAAAQSAARAAAEPLDVIKHAVTTACNAEWVVLSVDRSGLEEERRLLAEDVRAEIPVFPENVC